MDRTERIFTLMKQLSQNRFEQSQKLIEVYCETHGDEIAAEVISAVKKAFVQAADLQSAAKKGAARYLVLSHLYCGVFTGGYSIKLDVFDRCLYADPHVINVYLTLNWLYDFLADDMAYFRKELVKQHITSLKEYELEQIRYRYVYCYHAVALDLISESIPALVQMPEFNRMNVEPEFEVLFGGYMDKAVVIWPNAEGENEVFPA